MLQQLNSEAVLRDCFGQKWWELLSKKHVVVKLSSQAVRCFVELLDHKIDVIGVTPLFTENHQNYVDDSLDPTTESRLWLLPSNQEYLISRMALSTSDDFAAVIGITAPGRVQQLTEEVIKAHHHYDFHYCLDHMTEWIEELGVAFIPTIRFLEVALIVANDRYSEKILQYTQLHGEPHWSYN